MPIRKLALLALAVACAGAVGAAAIAAVSNEGAAPGQTEAPVQSADDLAVANLSVLTQPRTAEDELPAATAASAAARIPYGANVELSKRVAQDATHVVYAVPAHDYICTVVPDLDGSTTGCALTKDIVGGTAGPALILQGDLATFYAVVPDGVSSVTLHMASGKSRAVPVQNGAYIATVAASTNPQTVTYNTPAGPVTERVPMPPASRRP